MNKGRTKDAALIKSNSFLLLSCFFFTMPGCCVTQIYLKYYFIENILVFCKLNKFRNIFTRRDNSVFLQFLTC